MPTGDNKHAGATQPQQAAPQLNVDLTNEIKNKVIAAVAKNLDKKLNERIIATLAHEFFITHNKTHPTNTITKDKAKQLVSNSFSTTQQQSPAPTTTTQDPFTKTIERLQAYQTLAEAGCLQETGEVNFNILQPKQAGDASTYFARGRDSHEEGRFIARETMLRHGLTDTDKNNGKKYFLKTGKHGNSGKLVQGFLEEMLANNEESTIYDQQLNTLFSKSLIDPNNDNKVVLNAQNFEKWCNKGEYGELVILNHIQGIKDPRQTLSDFLATANFESLKIDHKSDNDLKTKNNKKFDKHLAKLINKAINIDGLKGLQSFCNNYNTEDSQQASAAQADAQLLNPDVTTVGEGGLSEKEEPDSAHPASVAAEGGDGKVAPDPAKARSDGAPASAATLVDVKVAPAPDPATDDSKSTAKKYKKIYDLLQQDEARRTPLILNKDENGVHVYASNSFKDSKDPSQKKPRFFSKPSERSAALRKTIAESLITAILNPSNSPASASSTTPASPAPASPAPASLPDINNNNEKIIDAVYQLALITDQDALDIAKMLELGQDLINKIENFKPTPSAEALTLNKELDALFKQNKKAKNKDYDLKDIDDSFLYTTHDTRPLAYNTATNTLTSTNLSPETKYKALGEYLITSIRKLGKKQPLSKKDKTKLYKEIYKLSILTGQSTTALVNALAENNTDDLKPYAPTLPASSSITP